MTKKKNLIKWLLGAVCAVSLFTGIGLTQGNTQTASAATYTSSHKCELNVTHYGATAIYLYSSGTTEVSIDSGVALGFAPTKVEVILPKQTTLGRYKYTKRVKNFKLTGPVTYEDSTKYSNTSKSNPKTVTYNLPTLTEGKYNLSMYTHNDYSGTVGDTASSVSFDFYVDMTKPTISGASTSTTGKYTNAAFTVSASDAVSGVENLYMKTPTSSSYVAVGTSKTVTAGSTNGLYSWYAVDAAGNQTATHYVYYDSTKSVGSIKNASGTTLTSTYTNGTFYYTATDSGSDVSYMQYKKPGASSWSSYTSGTKITASATNGLYQFRTYDKANNVSEISSISLDSNKPSGTLYGGSSVVANGGTTNADYVKFVASDTFSGLKNTYIKEPGATSYTTYVNGSQYVANGEYSFYCEDVALNQSVVYTIKKDGESPVLACEQSDFYATYDGDFTVTASDEHSSFSFYYKKPNMTEYELVSGNSYTIYDTEPDGKYYFFAVDELNNSTAYMWIELSVAYPEAQIIKFDDVNKYKITWSDDSTGVLNGSAYTKNTWIAQEGNYTFSLTNKKNRTTTYTFSLSHAYEVIELIVPTCTVGGYSVYGCVSCDDTYIADYTNPTGHSYIQNYVEVSCTKDGGMHHVCENCGDEYVTDKVTALGHAYEEIVMVATCTTDGCRRYSCTRCEYYYDTEVTPALGHTYNREVERTANCTENGLRSHTCERCSDFYETDIPATGHTYEIVDEKNDGGRITRTYSCSICWHTYSEELGNQYEDVSNYVEYLFQQYSPYMIWVFLATAGVWSIAMGVALIVAKKNEDKEKAKKMIVNYCIGLIIIFGILVAAPYLVRGIAWLIAG